MESGSESNEEVNTLSNFLFPVNNFRSTSDSGMRTPPIYTTASVPFRWEEEPGKPRPCTALIAFPTANKYLELQLPPRLLQLSSDSKMTSPTTVLNEGPYVAAGNMMIQSSVSNSMRFKKSSFGIPDYEISSRGLLGDMVLIKNNRGKGKRGFFSSWPAGKKNSSQKLDEDVDLSFSKEDEMTKMRRNGSLISHAKPSPTSSSSSSSFLASLCEGIIKHVIPLKMSRTRTVKKKMTNRNRFNTPPT